MNANNWYSLTELPKLKNLKRKSRSNKRKLKEEEMKNTSKSLIHINKKSSKRKNIIRE
jgi:hypothetical protein